MYNADTPSALESLRDGASGISPISGNFYPELYGHFLRLFDERKDEEVELLNSYLTVMDHVTHDFYPLSAKLFLEKRGLDICTNTRIPMSKMTTKDKNMDALNKLFQQIADELEIKLAL